MPVKLSSNASRENEARIEIIPLIDIMFFLLAAFMLVSLSMVNMKSVPVHLPSATSASMETKQGFVNLSVDVKGRVYWDREPIGSNELIGRLSVQYQSNKTLRVFISGDTEARHGDMIQVLDWVRSSGVQKVAFETRSPDVPSDRIP
jgi:biopolymer transport protein ExbD